MWLLGFIVFVLVGIISVVVTGWLFVQIVINCIDMLLEHIEQGERGI